MSTGYMFIACAVSAAAAAQGPSVLPTPEVVINARQPAEQQGRADTGVAPAISLLERTARGNARLEKPQTLFDIKQIAEESFGVEFSLEPLPEQCAGAEDPGLSLDPFTINVGERFGDVIARLEEASQGRWIFEEIHGVPVLRPNNAFAGHGTLLDTIVTAKIEASTMWEAVCALARAVNKVNNVYASGTRPLMITFFSPGLLMHPPPEFIETKSITVSLDHVPAREGLCAIFAQMGVKYQITYLYTCMAPGKKPDYDYVWIDAYDSGGKMVDGGKMKGADIERLSKTADWMSDDAILAVQAPKPGKPATSKPEAK